LPADGRFCVETGFMARKQTQQIHHQWLRPTRTGS
jgi:hypothetical protein